jgi:hypothetical protein
MRALEPVVELASASTRPGAVRAAAVYALGCLLARGVPARVRVGRGLHERLDDDPVERLLPLP